jgi:hypothetical protein
MAPPAAAGLPGRPGPLPRPLPDGPAGLPGRNRPLLPACRPDGYIPAFRGGFPRPLLEP